MWKDASCKRQLAYVASNFDPWAFDTPMDHDVLFTLKLKLVKRTAIAFWLQFARLAFIRVVFLKVCVLEITATLLALELCVIEHCHNDSIDILEAVSFLAVRAFVLAENRTILLVPRVETLQTV